MTIQGFSQNEHHSQRKPAISIEERTEIGFPFWLACGIMLAAFAGGMLANVVFYWVQR